MLNGKGLCTLHKVAWVLVIVGAVNWGVIGVLQLNIVATFLGSWPMVERVVYLLVGISALLMIAAGKCCLKSGCKCGDGGCGHCSMEDKKSAAGGQQM